MGEEQEIRAGKCIDEAFISGGWVVLNNCHLSLEFMGEMEDILNPKDREVHEEFRLWITCEPNKEFPLSLLQTSIKVTTEPPEGLQAGLSRTFNTIVNQDFLERVEPYDKWRSLVFSLCFMHSVVQERRKYGAIGFCIPYEFNTPDLEASLTFIEGHLADTQPPNNQAISWKAIQYMVSQVQYGGRITDAEDRDLFDTFTMNWLPHNDLLFIPNYCFNQTIAEFNYHIPDVLEHSRLLDYITTMPPKDRPPIFGLHDNANLTKQ